MTRMQASLLRAVVLLAALAVVNFLLPRALPGSPLTPGAGVESALLPSASWAELRRTYALDRPLPEQFAGYARMLARANLGRSIVAHRPVAAMILERLPWTLLPAGIALVLALAAGLWLGTLSVTRPRGWTARVLAPGAVLLGSLPEFLVAMGLIIAFSVRLPWFPAAGARTPFAAAPSGIDIARHAALPIATLLLAFLPAFFLLSRGALAAVYRAPYLMTARGKGLREGRVLWHAWRNALPPVLTLFGLRFGLAVAGVVVVERVFAYPGIGMLLVDAVRSRDYPVLQGILLVTGAAMIAMNLLLEVLAGALDPRVREDAA